MNNWHYKTPGIPDEMFIRGSVPMTKEEVRTITLAKMRLIQDTILWDIGAGTGSIAVESARLVTHGKVYAVEKNHEGARLIIANCQRFRVDNVEVVEGAAPEALDTLPAPNRVVIGGTGGNLTEILDVVCAKLSNDGIIVCNAILLDTVAEFNEYFKKHPEYRTETIQVAITRVEKVAGKSMLKANNPIFIQTASKEV